MWSVIVLEISDVLLVSEWVFNKTNLAFIDRIRLEIDCVIFRTDDELFSVLNIIYKCRTKHEPDVQPAAVVLWCQTCCFAYFDSRKV